MTGENRRMGILGKSVKNDFGPIRKLTQQRGGFFRDMSLHCASFVPGNGTLVVSFDETLAVRAGGVRMPWGKPVIEAQGWSHLGIMEKRENWYRDSDILDFFDGLRRSGFFQKFRKVIFYGYSMGSYGAILFSVCAPAAQVILLGPRMTHTERDSLAQTVIETDGSGRYQDIHEAVARAGQVTIVSDPTHVMDRRHAASFASPHTVFLNTPHLGHVLSRELHGMGILKDVFLLTALGRMDHRRFARLYRARRTFAGYHYRLLIRLIVKEHTRLALVLVDYVIQQANGAPRPRFLQYRKGLRQAVKNGEVYVLDHNPLARFDLDWGLMDIEARQEFLDSRAQSTPKDPS